MLHIWPTVGAVLAFVAISSMFIATVYFLGSYLERLLLATIPVDVAARHALSWTGYGIGCLWLVFNLPGLAVQLIGSARTYTSALPDELAPV